MDNGEPAQGISLYVSVSQNESGKIKTSASAHMTMDALNIQEGGAPDAALANALAIALGVASLAKNGLATILDGVVDPDVVAAFVRSVKGSAQHAADTMAGDA